MMPLMKKYYKILIPASIVILFIGGFILLNSNKTKEDKISSDNLPGPMAELSERMKKLEKKVKEPETPVPDACNKDVPLTVDDLKEVINRKYRYTEHVLIKSSKDQIIWGNIEGYMCYYFDGEREAEIIYAPQTEFTGTWSSFTKLMYKYTPENRISGIGDDAYWANPVEIRVTKNNKIVSIGLAHGSDYNSEVHKNILLKLAKLAAERM